MKPSPALYTSALASFLMVIVSMPVSAKTWYIRKDGGSLYSSSYTHGQCNGKVNAAYPGKTNAQWTPATAYSLGTVITDNMGHYETVTKAGTSGTSYWYPSWGSTTKDGTVVWTRGATYPVNQNCAVSHPYWLLNQSSWTWLTSAGDTIRFEDNGPYYMGLHNNTTGLGYDWPHCSGDAADCALPQPIPVNTKIYGAGAGSCHQTDSTMTGPAVLKSLWVGHGALKNATKLLGINSVFYVFDLQGSKGVDLECFDISQATQCTDFGNTYRHCNNNGGNGNGDDYAVHGIFLEHQIAQGPTDATLKDIEVHGLASEGISGGHLNRSSGDTFTASDIYLMGNGGAGWDWDGGGCGTSCENVGTMNLNWLRISWNGCVEVLPDGGTVGGKGYTDCADDNNLGYGDGWAMIATQGAWTVNHGLFRWNTQDGFDSLHTSDDLAHPPTAITIENSWAEGNEGQTFKIGFSSHSLAENNVSIANCRRLSQPFSPNPTGYNKDLSDFCRAAGDQWALIIKNGMGPMKLIHNTSVGYGATMYDIACAPRATCSTGTQMIFQDNISVGYLDPVTGDESGGLYFQEANPFSNPGSAIDHNLWHRMRHGTCPQGAKETSYICTNPEFTNPQIDSFNPALLPGSRAVRAGSVISGVTTDFRGFDYANPPSIGALQAR